jgi:hypothetical protein
MNIIVEILRGLVALFVDDELLAVGALCVVSLTVLLINVFGTHPLMAGIMLLCGNMLAGFRSYSNSPTQVACIIR